MFLEQYTAAPIEQELATLYGQAVTRREIVEIGALASAGGGSSVFLFAALASYLDFRNVRYTVVTGTLDLRRHLKMLGLQPQTLCEARPSLLAPTDDDWGNYYATRPYVLAGSVAHGVECLQRTLGSVYENQEPFCYHTGSPS